MSHAVNKGYPLSHTIFNMAVDAVICHWVMLIAEDEDDPDGLRRAIQWLAELFYAYDGILASLIPARL